MELSMNLVMVITHFELIIIMMGYLYMSTKTKHGTIYIIFLVLLFTYRPHTIYTNLLWALCRNVSIFIYTSLSILNKCHLNNIIFAI